MRIATPKMFSKCNFLAIMAFVIVTGCSVKPEVVEAPAQTIVSSTSDAASTHAVPTPRPSPSVTPTAYTLPDAPVLEDFSPTPLVMKTATISPIEVTPAGEVPRDAPFNETLGNAFPREVQPEELTDLCGSLGSDLRLSERRIEHNKVYKEIDGRFELALEAYAEFEMDVDSNAQRWIYKDEHGTKTGELRIVDEVQYIQHIIDGKESKWTAEPWDDGSSNPDSSSNERVVDSQSSSGESVGGAPDEQPLKVCGQSVDWVTNAIDYGTETLNGVEVRRIALLLDVSKVYGNTYDRVDELILEYWVDATGRAVQWRQEELRTSVQRGRSKFERLAVIYYGVPIAIKAPEIFKGVK